MAEGWVVFENEAAFDAAHEVVKAALPHLLSAITTAFAGPVYPRQADSTVAVYIADPWGPEFQEGMVFNTEAEVRAMGYQLPVEDFV